MVSDEIVAAIDVGTTKVCTIVGRKVGKNGIQILGYSTAKNYGMRKGVVSDVSAAERAVRVSIKAVEDKTGHKVDSAFVGVTGAHVRFENRHERLEIENRKGIVTADDVASAPKKLSESIDLPGRTVIHANSISYTLDGESGIRHPVGMHSKEMQVEAHFVTGSNTFIDRLVDVIEVADVRINSLVLEPLASGLAVLTPEERHNGAVIVDIGGGTTDIVAFKGGSIYYTGVIPVGGYQFTNDIALSFSTPFEAAEAIKLEHASAEFQPASAGEHILVPVIGRDKELKVSRLEICQLVRERAMELARMIKVKLDSERVGNAEDTVLVLTGGASNLPGFAQLVEKVVGITVRHGMPDVHGTVPAELRDTVYATGVGILLWGLTEYVPDEAGFGVRNGNEANGNGHALENGAAESNGFFGSLRRRLGALMP
jgi:cell division protein FtsA